MNILLVHGNPETTAVWRRLVDVLTNRGVEGIDAVAPPGFGAPPPAGPATPDAYVAWLAAAAAAHQPPVHLVGHDWGAGHVLGLVARRPDLVATWAVDCAGLVHPDHVWHDMARVWQTPGAGEEAVAAMVGLPAAERAAAYRSLGLPDEVAADMAAACDEAMGRCILELYRGAVPPWGPDLGHRLAELGPARPPGLVIVAGRDPYVPADLGADVAARLGADICDLPDAGHWWMLTDPEPVADALVGLWSTLSGGAPS